MNAVARRRQWGQQSVTRNRRGSVGEVAVLTVLKNWRARRRLKVSVETGAGPEAMRALVENVSSRPVTLEHVGIAWPYRRVKLRRKLKSYFKHGHHWATIGWTHHRLAEVDAAAGLPLTVQPGGEARFDLPLGSAKGSWDGGRLTFVLRLRDARGRNYYSAAVTIAP